MLRQYSSASQEHKFKQTRPTIKLIGDTSQNIAEIVQGLRCSCGIQNELRNILEIYANKIHKLRLQRDQLLAKVQALQNQQCTKRKNLSYTPQLLEIGSFKKDIPKKQEMNIFELLTSSQDKARKRSDSNIIVDLSQSQIQHHNSHEEESMLITLQSSEQKNGRENFGKDIVSSSLDEEYKYKQDWKGGNNPKTPKNNSSFKYEGSKKGKMNPLHLKGSGGPRNFQEFLQDKINSNFSTHRYIEDIQKFRKKKDSYQPYLVSDSGENFPELQENTPKVSEFRLPLKEWPNKYNLMQ